MDMENTGGGGIAEKIQALKAEFDSKLDELAASIGAGPESETPPPAPEEEAVVPGEEETAAPPDLQKKKPGGMMDILMKGRQ